MRAAIEGQLTPVSSGDTQRVLGYLALSARSAHRREVLSELLWGESDRNSRRALSDALYRLRQQLGDGWLTVTNDTIALATEVELDVVDFDRLTATGDFDDAERAVALYDGDLVPGVYDDWCTAQRTARRTAYLGAVELIVAEHERAGNLQRALFEARRLVIAEPLDEAVQRTYLRLLGRLHRYGEAVAHFDELTRLLADDLGIAPSPSTTQIVEQMIREREAAATVVVDTSSRFVGRAAERAAALTVVEAMFQGTGAALCIEGVAGIGKSRLLGEVVASARWRKAMVLIGDVQEVPETSPLAPIERALTPVLAGPMRLHLEEALDATTLQILGALHDPWRNRQDQVTPPANAAATMQRALQTLGTALAGLGPVVLVLDDVQWASNATWDGLIALAEGFTRAGGLLVVAYRRPEIESTAGWPILQSWDSSSIATFVQLGPLSASDIAELLGADHQQQVDEVLSLTGGIPFYVHQWLDGVAGDRHAHAEDLIRRRGDALPAAERSALVCAAVLGDDVPFRVWMDVLGVRPIELAPVSERLESGRWLTPTSRGHAFTHDLLRAAVYEGIDDEARRELHARAAAVIAEVDPSNVRARAYHLDRAGLGVEAVELYRQAAASYVRDFAVPDAIAMWSRALELLPAFQASDRLAVALDVSSAREMMSDYAGPRAVLDEALALAEQLGDEPAQLRAMLLAGGAAARTGEADRAESILRAAIELAERLGDDARLAHARFCWADFLAQTGRWSEAQPEFHASLALVDPVDVALRGRVLRGLAIAAVRTGRPVEAVDWLEQALVLHRASRDRLSELVALSNLLATNFELGNWDAVVTIADQTLSMARALGDKVTVGISSQLLGLASLAFADYAAAFAWVTEAEECFAAAERRRLLGLTVNTRGLIAEDAGDLVEAIRCYEVAMEIATGSDSATEMAYAQHDLGALRWKMGEPAIAIPLLRAAADAWTKQGHPMLRAKSEAVLGLCLLDVGKSPEQVAALAEGGVELLRTGEFVGEQPHGWLWSLHQLLQRTGIDGASNALAAARAEVLRQAATISDPERRRGFLERVPLNRSIMAAGAGGIDHPAQVVVRVASVEAPLGRPLQPDEYVEVAWTLHTVADDAITDKATRRRQRLRRLLDEAANQNAAPTDDDLARALGVSRRTVLRDMQAMESDSIPLTRRRRATTCGNLTGTGE